MRFQILIVDDFPDIRLSIKDVLKDLGHNCFEAVNGADALQYCEVKSFDLIFMVGQMPVMDGFSATKIIREKNSAVPVVCISEKQTEETKRKFKEAQMSYWLMKPFNPEQIKKVLDIFLK